MSVRGFPQADASLPQIESPAPAPTPAHEAPRLAPPPVQASLVEAHEQWLAVYLPVQAPVASPEAQLTRLALLAQHFTPRVSLEPPDALVLEIRGSMRLFGGVRTLCSRLLEGCAAAGVQPVLALAPTPLAALAGARSGRPFSVRYAAQLVSALRPLPLSVLRWPPQVLERLAKVGVHTVGEALRLPRAGFARRFGVEQLAALDRLTGRRADPRPEFRPAQRFHERRSCTYELTHHEAIVAALAPLIARLGRFLEQHQCGITALHCRLRHRHAPPTQYLMRLVAPLADPKELQALLAEHLARIVLPEAVRECELRSGRLIPRAGRSACLWQPGEHGGQMRTESVDFIETLRARLGEQAVHGLKLTATHRPEAASEPAELGSRETGMPPWPAFRRPLWLLPSPQRLPESGGVPRHHGALRLLSEPERIETGWWEEEQVARDYYSAIDERGVRLWIYRERRAPHRWFLHGLWG